ncbi:MAG: hypothetical protein HYV68_02015 [Candidatus Taylorbacteria bacterium]|nr:hypothetical protein [Candidatus Taylorbacteria bacterium]
MALKNDVARLERAATESAVWLRKLRLSVDNLAKLLASCLPSDGNQTALPGGYGFACWSSGQFELTKVAGAFILVQLELHCKGREHLLAFADDVAKGWLNDVSVFLEKQTSRMRTTSETIDQTLEGFIKQPTR